MSKRYFANLIGKAALIDTKVNKICLPMRINCSMPTNSIVVDCGTEFNCQKCCDTDDKYYLPVMLGDEFDIQTHIFDMFNTDPTDPGAGFGTWIDLDVIDLQTGDSVNVGYVVDTYYVGWDGNKSYQVVRIKIGNDTPICFKIIYKVYNKNGDTVGEYCSQHFKMVEQCDINDTYIFESKYKNYDCEGNWYGMPVHSVGAVPFNYSNKIRLKAYKSVGTPIRETLSRNGLTQKKSVKYIDEYDIFYIPLYIVKYFNSKLDNSNKMLINGKYYNIEVGEAERVNDCFFNLKISVISQCNEKC